MDTFSYNIKTGNIMYKDKHIVYNRGVHYFFYKLHEKEMKLTEDEMLELRKTGKWFIENYNSDFGEELNEFFLH